MVLICGRLVVVISSFPPGDFFFVFSANLLFWGAGGRAARVLLHPKKRLMGMFPWVPETYPKAKIALLALKTTRFEMAPRALGGAFLGVRADSSRRT